ncbi:hypothetical protein ACFQXB_11950 [Plastorhodobacter daqingensis]|uniref:Apolipoprotein acyltransferase n=1 Tax=Plastorhodobacter daqingensis TaxID=1387281 RepID=A0ABW2UN39_9RHOB
MMIVLAGIVIGAIIGVMQARKRQGNRLDMAQYAAAWAIFLALIGVFITIFAERMF